ncbi:hypothetical protein AMJ57_00845 [Parcubacteria bacterium SG8_24]|nr:MAG: hypothetical protein AMJ57_00845 [Parcubacteria bacterium SG8_24]
MNPESRENRPPDISELLTRDARFDFIRESKERLPEAEWYLVGGAVRDHLLGRPAGKDFDFVIRRASLDDLASLLGRRGRVDLVGRNFGVLKFVPQGLEGEEPIDIAWPRTEIAGGSGGYRDFDVQSDPDLPLEDDLQRRDFTMNAMAWDVGRSRLVDPHHGQADLERRLIRAVGEPRDRFREDYSRILRAMRFACQLGFRIEEGTWKAIREMVSHLDDTREVDGKIERVVPYETVSRELLKALAADSKESVRLWEESGALFRLFPELDDLRYCPQSPERPAGSTVWEHTRSAVAHLSGPGFDRMFPGEKPEVRTVLAVLFHGLGRVQTGPFGIPSGDRPVSESAGAQAVRSLARRLRFSSVPGLGVSRDDLAWLVEHHRLPGQIDVGAARHTLLERLFLDDRRKGRALLHAGFAIAAAADVGREEALANLCRLQEKVIDLERLAQDGGPASGRLLSGRQVMEVAGIGPGPEVGRLLEELREAQLRGEVTTIEEAQELLRRLGD